MGEWIIIIEGKGMHHNNNPKDANEIAMKTIDSLKKAGQEITHTSFVSGAKDSLI